MHEYINRTPGLCLNKTGSYRILTSEEEVSACIAGVERLEYQCQVISFDDQARSTQTVLRAGCCPMLQVCNIAMSYGI